MNETRTAPESAIRARFVPDSFASLSLRAFAASHCDTQGPCPRAERGPSPAWKTDAHLVLVACDPRRPPAWRRRHRRARADQHRQDPSRHRADARPFVRHDRAAAAAAGARGLQQGRRPGRRRERRAHHRRREDQAAQPALLGGDRRGDAARSRCRLRRHRRGAARRRPRARPRLHRPHAQPPRPRGDAGAGRRHRAADGREAAARRQHRAAAAAVDAHFTPATRSSRGCRGAAPSSRSRPTRSTPSPN